jgi:hypothetical protein
MDSPLLTRQLPFVDIPGGKPVSITPDGAFTPVTKYYVRFHNNGEDYALAAFTDHPIVALIRVGLQGFEGYRRADLVTLDELRLAVEVAKTPCA